MNTLRLRALFMAPLLLGGLAVQGCTPSYMSNATPDQGACRSLQKPEAEAAAKAWFEDQRPFCDFDGVTPVPPPPPPPPTQGSSTRPE